MIRIAIVGPLVYVLLIVTLRVSGKRTLSKMNAFDFVVTVVLGSLLATVLLDSTVGIVEGAVAMTVLVVAVSMSSAGCSFEATASNER